MIFQRENQVFISGNLVQSSFSLSAGQLVIYLLLTKHAQEIRYVSRDVREIRRFSENLITYYLCSYVRRRNCLSVNVVQSI